MRTAITAIALAGLTTAAHAQNVGTVTLTASAATAVVGDIITIGVVVSDNIIGNSVIAFDITVDSPDNGFEIVPGSLTPHDIIFGFSGSEFAAGVTALGAGPDILGPDIDPSLDGVTVYTFRVEIGPLATDQVAFTPSDGPGPNEALLWGKPGIVLLPTPYHEYVFEGVTITVVPSPLTLAPLALAIPLAARRRR